MKPRGKFDAKSDEGVFLGYYSNSRAYRVYKKRTMTLMKSINVRVDDYLPPLDSFRIEDPFVGLVHEVGNTLNIPKDALFSSDEDDPVSTKVWTILDSEHLVIDKVRTIEEIQ